MESKELRIGNLFKWVFTNKIDTVQDIYSLDKEEYMVNSVSIKDCEGIVLTGEWMIKFGWGKGEYNTEYLNNVSLKMYTLSYTVNASMLCIESPKDIIEIPDIKYIHQLQNLFYSLTGKELDI